MFCRGAKLTPRLNTQLAWCGIRSPWYINHHSGGCSRGLLLVIFFVGFYCFLVTSVEVIEIVSLAPILVINSVVTSPGSQATTRASSLHNNPRGIIKIAEAVLVIFGYGRGLIGPTTRCAVSSPVQWVLFWNHQVLHAGSRIKSITLT